MSRRIEFSTSTGEVALTSTGVKTIIEVTFSSQNKGSLLGWGVSFDGASVTAAPGQITIARKSAAGTGTASTGRDWDEDVTPSAMTSSGRVNTTAEGTVTYDFQPRNVHPQAGFEIWYPEGKEIPCIAGEIIGIRGNFAAAVNTHAWMLIEE
jgi:hypothetical protein